MQIMAYAKINLTLDITGKRADGYHLLRMVMQSVSLCDQITLTTLKPGIQVSCGHSGVPCGEDNTVYKAANAFFTYCGEVPHAQIDLQKTIPSQAGLGGGSTDAAAVLSGLNRLLHTDYSDEILCKIGLQVGADVPFCLLGGTALAEGIGEKLTALPPMPTCSLVICKPSVGMNTKEAYALSDALEIAEGFTEPMLQALHGGSLSKVADSVGNDFERVVVIQEVERIQKVMRSFGALGACMTGSGSAVYGIFNEKISSVDCKKRLEQEFSQVFLCQPTNTPYKILD